MGVGSLMSRARKAEAAGPGSGGYMRCCADVALVNDVTTMEEECA